MRTRKTNNLKMDLVGERGKNRKTKEVLRQEEGKLIERKRENPRANFGGVLVACL